MNNLIAAFRRGAFTCVRLLAFAVLPLASLVAAPDITPPTTSNVGVNQVTFTLRSSETGTGYFTVLAGANATPGTGAQTKAGQTSTGAAALRIGSLPLTTGTPGTYTLSNLAANTAYTVCFTADDGTTVQPVATTTSFTTAPAPDWTQAVWSPVGSASLGTIITLYLRTAIGPDGLIYIAYQDSSVGRKATVKRFDGTSWTTVGTPGLSAGEASVYALRFAPNGTPYVAYCDVANGTKATVMRFNGTTWVPAGNTAFSAGYAYSHSLAFAPDGTPYLAYLDGANGDKLTVMRLSGNTWTAVGAVAFSAGQAITPSLTFTTDGLPLVAFMDGANGNKATVMRFSGGTWSALGGAGLSAGQANTPILTISPDGNPALAYMDVANGNKATVMRFNGSAWTTVGSVGSTVASSFGFIIAADGAPVVIYGDTANTNLGTAMRYDGSNWLLIGGGNFSSVQPKKMDLSIAPNGLPVIGFTRTNSIAVITLRPPPTVTGVTLPANRAYPAGSILEFTAALNRAVTVTGTPRIALTIGTTTRYATYDAAHSTATSLAFRYTIAPEDRDTDGISVATNIDLNGGTIVDATASTAASLVLNGLGSTSAITVITPLAITAPPTQRFVLRAGQPLSLSVAATGTAPLTYKWKKNGFPISGATSATYSKASAVATDAGCYVVEVSDAVGAVTRAITFVTPVANPHVLAFGNNDYGQANVPLDVGDAVAVSIGVRQSLVLRSDGTIRTWGSSAYGLNTIPSGLSEVVAIATGWYYSYALKADGTITVWGEISTYSTVPAGLANVIALSCAGGHTLALKSDGTVTAWGSNSNGQATVPSGLSGVVAVAGGYDHSLALKSDGTVVAWGSNSSGQCTIPSGLSGVVAIGAGSTYSVALKSDGTVTAWGYSGYTAIPSGLTGVVGLAVGPTFATAIKSDGTTTSWGTWTPLTTLTGVSAASYGPIGGGSSMNCLVLRDAANDAPATITACPATATVIERLPVSWAATATGDYLTYQWYKDGAAIASATSATYSITRTTLADAATYTLVVKDSAGRTATANTVLTVTPRPKLSAPPAARQIVPLGDAISLSVSTTGNAPFTYQWRRNGQPISGATDSTFARSAATLADAGCYTVDVTDATGLTESGIGGWVVVPDPAYRAHVLPIGSNSYGATTIPADVGTVTALAPGAYHGVALRLDGTAKTWGQNTSGDTTIPETATEVVAVAAGTDHTIYLKADGTVVTSGAAASATLPSGLGNVVAIAAGYQFGVGLRADGTVAAWGSSSNNQLAVPSGLTDVIAIAAGGNHTLTLKRDGTVVAWGYNGSGQCNVPSSLANIVAIGAGSAHSLALRADGTIVGWGDSYGGKTTAPSDLTNAIALDGGGQCSVALGADGTVRGWGAAYAPLPLPTGVTAARAILANDSYGFILRDASGDPALAITSLPATINFGFGQTARIKVVASGAYLTYQWSKNGTAISGATSAELALPNAQAADAATYSVAIQDAAGRTVTGSTVLGVLTAPTIATAPTQRTVVSVGDAFSLNVVPAGTGPFSYQWRKNGLPIPGATNDTFAKASATRTDAACYTVVASDANGVTVVSPGAWIVVTQPANRVVGWGYNYSGQVTIPSGLEGALAVSAGSAHSLALKADGTVAAWGDNSGKQCNVPVGLTNVVAIAAGSSQSLALRADGTVVAWGSVSTAVPTSLTAVVAIATYGSDSAALTADGRIVAWGSSSSYLTPAATEQPFVGLSLRNQLFALRVDTTVAALNSGYTIPDSGFTALAAGNYHLSALRADGTVSVFGQSFSYGENNIPAGLANVAAISVGTYYTIALKTDGTLASWGSDIPTNTTSQFGMLAIAAGYGSAFCLGLHDSATDVPPVITTPPANTSVVEGRTATFTVAATGYMLSYQWKKNGTTISAATSDTLTLSNVQLADATTYTVEVKNAAGQITAASAALTVLPLPVVTTAPARRIILDQGQTLSLAVAATGADTVTYQWKRNGIALAGATSATYTKTGALAADSGCYSVVVTDGNGGSVERLAFVLVRGLTGTPEVVAWGYNSDGQAGVPAGLTNIVGVAAGLDFSCALRLDGTAIAWGYNSASSSSGSTQIQPVLAGFNDLVQICAGWRHVLAVKLDGTVAACGDNYAGAINLPAGLADVVAVAAGNASSYALKSDGTVVAWGSNTNGQATVPTGLAGVMAISAGRKHVLALKSDGTVVAWGDNTYGQTNVSASLNNVVGISAGEANSMAVKADGTVFAWGANGSGQGAVPVGLRAVAVASGSGSSFALRANGSLVAWGDNTNAQACVPGSLYGVFALAGNYAQDHVLVLRDTTATPPPQFTTRPAARTIRSVGEPLTLTAAATGVGSITYQWKKNAVTITGATGATFTIPAVAQTDAAAYSVEATDAVTGLIGRALAFVIVAPDRSQIVAWGQNDYSQRDLAGAGNQVVAISGGGRHTLALRADGTVFAAGATTHGQTTVPTGLANVVAVSAGMGHSLALRADGKIAAWGLNTDGETNIPLLLDDVIAIAAGYYHSLALRADGSIVGWGSNTNGEASTSTRYGATTQIAAGYGTTLIRTASGYVRGWGLNDSGQSTVPDSGLNIYRISSLASGGNFAIAVGTGFRPGIPVAWGHAALTDTSWLSNTCEVSAGTVHWMARRTDGTYVSWGYDNYGQSTTPADAVDAFAVSAGALHSLALRDVAPPRILTQTSALTVTAGQPIHLEVVSLGRALHYRWFRNGEEITNTDSPAVGIASAELGHAGAYTVEVSNSFGTVASQPILLTVNQPTGYAGWKLQNFTPAGLADPLVSGPNATPLADGMTNLLKYALGLGVLERPATAPIVLQHLGTEVELTFHRPANRPDLTYKIQQSSTLNADSWADCSGVPALDSEANGLQQWSLRVATSGSPRLFLRLSVELTGN